MKQKKVIIISFLLGLCTLISVCCVSAFALEWDGSSTGGGGAGGPADVRGFAIRTLGDNVIGYRFSIVNKSGANKVSKVIDVFRNNYYGDYAYTYAYKFNTKYNKKQLINYQNSGFRTSRNSTNCYKEADMGFTTSLPVASGMSIWQQYAGNLNNVLSKLGTGSLSSLQNGDKIIVEPLYDVMLETVYHAPTVTELALYGKYLLGVNSDGGVSSTASSWGFISAYTNRHYPNELYTPDGQGLWSSVTALSNRATFYTIINSGYGSGIAYIETKPDFSPDLSVQKCEAWSGVNNYFGVSTGNSFSSWTYGQGYPTSGNSIWYMVYFPPETENCYVKQTIWEVGGGSTSRNVWSNSNTWYDVSLSPTTISSTQSYITIKARVDWLDSNGVVQKYGAEKTFYIPIRPLIYRNKVTMFDYVGNVAAFQSTNGSSGKVYVGQMTYIDYTYTSGNSWGSANNLNGVMLKWSGNEWVQDISLINAAVNKNGSILSANSSQTLTSNIGNFRVPDNSGSGSSIIRYMMTTAWASDAVNTIESSYFTIPVVKADVQLTKIYLVDKDGYYIDEQDLMVGQEVTVQYKYYNNTECQIYVEGFDDMNNSLGIYAIEPYSYIYVSGRTFTVPDSRTYNIWGGVFLEGAGWNVTDWESNGTNNSMILSCKVNHPVTIQCISVNAAYREGTDVITSFWVKSANGVAYTPSSNLNIRIRIYDNSRTLIKTIVKTQVLIPSDDKNLIYVKWSVPSDTGGTVTVIADVLENGVYYNVTTKFYSTTPFSESQTPDTQFEKTAPTGFTMSIFSENTNSVATWYEYAYEFGSFIKKQYGYGLYSGEAKIEPATGETHKKVNGKWIMKSGYGISLTSSPGSTVTVGGYLTPSVNAYTSAQYFIAAFPEYKYSMESGKCTTLVNTSSTISLPTFKTYGKVHFTPLWFPDQYYIVGVIYSDCWTPSGMLTVKGATNSITINGSAYDDHYIGH